ncbi:MAG TPA: hypothetical protein VK121_02815 [Pseudogracilibacillus sp.]|nr:hypothetical protein [Pseudogracilibacillus sp.]
METFIPILIGILLSVVLYSLALLISRDRTISIMISALLPVIVFVMSLVFIDFTLINLNVVFSGTIIGIFINGLISFILKNKLA